MKDSFILLNLLIVHMQKSHGQTNSNKNCLVCLSLIQKALLILPSQYLLNEDSDMGDYNIYCVNMCVLKKYQ